jgi:hypothetical protein
MSVAGSSSTKWSRTPPWRNSEGQDHRQWDYHPVPYLSVGPPMPGLWGGSTDDVSALSILGGVVQIVGYTVMHFHLGWSRPDEGFGHRGYYIGDGRYGSVGDKQDRRDPRQENQMVRDPKLDGPVSLKIAAVPSQQRK